METAVAEQDDPGVPGIVAPASAEPVPAVTTGEQGAEEPPTAALSKKPSIVIVTERPPDVDESAETEVRPDEAALNEAKKRLWKAYLTKEREHQAEGLSVREAEVLAQTEELWVKEKAWRALHGNVGGCDGLGASGGASGVQEMLRNVAAATEEAILQVADRFTRQVDADAAALAKQQASLAATAEAEKARLAAVREARAAEAEPTRDVRGGERLTATLQANLDGVLESAERNRARLARTYAALKHELPLQAAGAKKDYLVLKEKHDETTAAMREKTRAYAAMQATVTALRLRLRRLERARAAQHASLTAARATLQKQYTQLSKAQELEERRAAEEELALSAAAAQCAHALAETAARGRRLIRLHALAGRYERHVRPVFDDPGAECPPEVRDTLLGLAQAHPAAAFLQKYNQVALQVDTLEVQREDLKEENARLNEECKAMLNSHVLDQHSDGVLMVKKVAGA